MYFRVLAHIGLITHIIMTLVCLFAYRLNAAGPEPLLPISYKELIERGRATKSPEGQFYYFNKALALRPDDPTALAERSLAYLRKLRVEGNYAVPFELKEQLRTRAMSDIRKAITLNPNLAVGFFAQGFGLRSVSKYDDAILSFTKAIELDSTNPMFYLYRADAYRRKKEYEKALNDCDAALKADTNAFRAHFVKASVFRNLKDSSKELDEYAKAVAAFPGEAEVYRRRAWAYKKHAKIDEAIADLSETIKRDPKNHRWYKYRASLYADKGMIDLAQADNKMQDQMNPEVHAAQGYALGASDEAIAAFNKAIELEPWRAHYYMRRGETWLLQKKYKNAINDLSKAIDMFCPEVAEGYCTDADSELAAMAYSYRGATYRQMGDKEAALSDLKKACDRGFCDDYKSTTQSTSP